MANEALDETSGRTKPAAATLEGKPEAKKRERSDLAVVPRKLRATVHNGGLNFAEPLDLPESTEVEILLRLAPKR